MPGLRLWRNRMDRRFPAGGSRTAPLAPAVAAAALVTGVCGLALAGLAGAAGGIDLGLIADPYVQRALRFTLLQASLSTALSLALGALLALALARRRFALRGAVIAALGALFVLPSIVAILGLVALYGRSGMINAGLHRAGMAATLSIYGLPGILLAHVFFNAPLAARIFLTALEAVPQAHWRLARALGFSPLHIFKIIDWPALRKAGIGAASLIFILCATSFAIVLALGGGPQAATLEVAIYESLRFDFNLPRAASLAFLQIITILLFFFAIEAITPRRAAEAAAQGGAIERGDARSLATRALDTLAFALAALVIAGPVIGAVIAAASGAFGLILIDPAFHRALAGSLLIALPAGLLSTALALAIAYGAAHLQIRRRQPLAARALSASASALLIVPPFALAAGLFIALRPIADPAAMAMPLVALVNALTALPIALRIIGPPVLTNAERHGRLAASLGVSGLARLRLIEAPLLRAPLGLALATVIAFSIGDLGVAALFGMGDTMTLPLYVYSLIGSYRMDQGGAAALLLCALILSLFIGIERAARGRVQHV